MTARPDDDVLSRRRRRKLPEEDHPSAVLRGPTEAVRALVEEPDLGLFPWEYQPERCRIGQDLVLPEEREAYSEVWVTFAGDPDRVEKAVRTTGVRLRWESGPREDREVPERSDPPREGPPLGDVV